MCAQCVESNGVGQLLVLVFSSQKLPGHRLEVALDVLLEARRLGGACLGLLELREGGPGPPASHPSGLTEHTLSPSRHLGVQMSFH